MTKLIPLQLIPKKAIKLMAKMILMLTVLMIGCEEQESNDFSRTILSVMRQGTDSTFFRKINEENQIIETRTAYLSAALITQFSYFNNGRVYKISSTLLNRRFGHRFLFNKQGDLAYYSFDIGNQNYASYVRTFHLNTLNTLSYEERGTPFVLKIPDYQNDNVDLFFTTVFYERMKIYIKHNPSSSFKPLYAHNSELLPMLKESRISLPDSVIFLKITALDRLLKLEREYHDTISIRRNNK